MKTDPTPELDAQECEDEDELQNAYFSIPSSNFYGNGKKEENDKRMLQKKIKNAYARRRKLKEGRIKDQQRLNHPKYLI